MRRNRIASVLFALSCAVGGAVAVNATPAGAVAAPSVDVVSVQTNLAGAAAAPSAALALEYHVIRDNFYTWETCESYRKQYAVNFPYHLASYCTRQKQSNGRHWLYVAYETCPDLVAAKKEA